MQKMFLFLVSSSLLVLTACGTADLSFDEAKKTAMENSNLIANLLANTTTPTQQTLSFTTTLDNPQVIEGKVDLNFTSQSQQNKETNQSKTDITFDANITDNAEIALSTSGNLTALYTSDTLFVTVEKLGIQSNDANIGMIAALLQGIQGQRFKLPFSGEEMLNGVDEYLTTLTSLQKEQINLFIEKGNQPYQGAFAQFNGKPAYQFTLDEAQIQQLIQEIAHTMQQLNQQSLSLYELPSTGNEETLSPTNIDIQFPLFEGNFVIVDKNNVAVVVDTFEIILDEVHLIGTYQYSSEGIFLQLKEKESGQELLHLIITKTKAATYDVDIQLGTTIGIKGTATTSIKKADLQLTFDLTIQLNLTTPLSAESGEILEEVPTTILLPFKGVWQYATIKSFDITEPTTAIDLIEMLGTMANYEV